jgi:hypothetical protein
MTTTLIKSLKEKQKSLKDYLQQIRPDKYSAEKGKKD